MKRNTAKEKKKRNKGFPYKHRWGLWKEIEKIDDEKYKRGPLER